MNPNEFMLHWLNKVKGFNVILKSYISIELKFCDKNEFMYVFSESFTRSYRNPLESF